jgi:phospholipid/cholesterol/gamma-HCH transport system ATP-binding protein
MSRIGPVAVRFDRVSKTIAQTSILEDVSFEVRRGAAFSILGRRGTGKTIALKLAIGLLKPDRGSIFINDQDIAELDHPALLQVRKSTGFVFQGAALFDSMSVAENIAFPLRCNRKRLPGELRETVRQQLAQVGLEQEIDKMPNDLSVGMRKLLGFARALACDPAILLVDDPWNGIDSVTAALIRDVLSGLRRRLGTTLLIAGNRMTDVGSVSEQLAVLDEGRIVACGAPNEVARSDHPVVKQFVLQQDF